MPGTWQRFTELILRKRLDRELDDEVAFHLQMLEDQFRSRGMSEAEARAAASREFGGVAHAKEAYREQRGLPFVETTARDIRHAVRALRRSPGFTAAAVLSLALGIGANTAVFSLFHAIMLRMLPVYRPEQLVSLYQSGGWIDGFSSYPLYEEIAKHRDLFSGVAARSGVAKVRFRERPDSRENFAFREFVSGNYFQMLGVTSAAGRLFTVEDTRAPGAAPYAILSYDCWRTRYGSDPAVIGSTVIVGEKPLTVIGVAAAGFHGIQVERRTDVWIPIVMSEFPLKNPNTWWLQIIARVRPDVPHRRLQAAVDLIMQQHLASVYSTGVNAAFRQRVMQQRLEVRGGGIGVSMLRNQFAKPLQVLMAAVGLVLLMACTNVANLLLARGAARRKEVALRFSLGATRARLVRQALTESLLLAASGAAAGTALGVWGTGAILHFLPEQAGNPLSAAPETAVLAFTLLVSILSVLLFGLVPALRSTAVHPASGLRSEVTGAAPTPVLRRTLVTAQVSFSVVLVVMAGLFCHSLFQLRSVDLGFRNQTVVAFILNFPREWRGRDLRAPYKQLADRLSAVPGVYSVSYSFPGPFQMGSSSASIRVPGSERTATRPADVETVYIAPRYFETLGAPLLRGREFDRNDGPNSRKVAIVNEAFVRAFLATEQHPENRYLSFDDAKPEGGERTWIVGVVRDMRRDGVQKPPAPAVYVPLAQADAGWPSTVLIRTQQPPASILPVVRREAARLGSSIVVDDFGTVRQRIDDSIFEQRLLAAVSGFFGLLALLLASVGLYGVVAYGTARRTAEIGVRIALGARRGQVLRMILGDSLALVAVGLGVGLLASVAAAKAVASILFGITPTDPVAFLGTGALLLATAVLATLLPARRAASIDPLRALRHE